ncbi:MAG: hypothetical protein H7256_03655, partial [Bdellovibrio sp.]|nr:hypothetical protein [Bdellovibrio sp.]
TKWGAKVLHSKSVEMAHLKNVKLFVGSAADIKSIGTTISAQADTKSDGLSVNSYSTVFKMQYSDITNSSYKDEFCSYIIAHQIAAPDILFADKDIFYIAGPKENLDLIQKIDFKISNFKLLRTDLCSVSLTCKEKPSEQIVKLAHTKLSEKTIQPERQVITANNINFFLEQKDKTAAIQILHSTI